MVFSELSFIQEKTGLTYNEETGILSGTKNSVPIAVFDNKKQRRFDIICGALCTDDIIPELRRATDSFPKKTVLGIENADGCIKIYCKGYNLMQENLPLLISLLEKLTSRANDRKIAVTSVNDDDILSLSDFAVIRKKSAVATEKKPAQKAGKRDIKSSLKGILGGVIGFLIGSSIFVLFLMLSEILSWIGAVIMAAAVISLYTVFSHKLKVFDIFATSFLVLGGWFFSNSFAYLFKIFTRQQEAGETVNLFIIMDNLPNYIAKHSDLINLYSNSLMVTFIFAVAGVIGSYLFYYKSHTRDMY